eukprot:358130-Chlamydomonas_euryale.AAC.3
MVDCSYRGSHLHAQTSSSSQRPGPVSLARPLWRAARAPARSQRRALTTPAQKTGMHRAGRGGRRLRGGLLPTAALCQPGLASRQGGEGMRDA